MQRKLPLTRLSPTLTDASVDTNVQGVSADVEIDVNRDAAAEAIMIKGWQPQTIMPHCCCGATSKEYH